MKNRYAVENNLITGIDGAHICATPYFTDENLQCVHESGAPLYKLEKGKHVLRSQAELEADEEYKAWANVPVKNKLKEIDISTVRGLREWMITQPDCPEWVKTHEQEAQSERAKLK